jgi:hypothetical protein
VCTIDEKFVRETDEELIAQDVKIHARPIHVAMAWMDKNSIYGDLFDKQVWEPLMEIYRRLYPSGDFSVPAMLEGGVALRDRMYPVRVSVGFGYFRVEPLKAIDIKHEELELIFQHNPEQGWKAFYGVCDLWDFAYGVDDLVKTNSPASELLNNAQSSLSAISRILTGSLDIDAAVQCACLTAELSMKAALRHLGSSDDEIRNFSHHLKKLSDALIAKAPRATDERLRAACTEFPNYVQTRYASHGLTRLELMALAMRAQFVAADAIRRVTDRNMGGEMEARHDCPARPEV